MAGSEKMSKSLGNVVTVGELLEQGHRGEVLRLALLSAHYRQPLEWSEKLVAQSKATLDRLYRTVGDSDTGEPDPDVLGGLTDDLNTPFALAKLGSIKDAPTLKASALLLGLLPWTSEDWFKGRPLFLSTRAHFSFSGSGTLRVERGEQFINDRIAERAAAKAERDFARADRIRAELVSDGILLEDTPAGTTWRRA
jgi:cysteinyl-tRNA synthetase